jgi:SAM-dependent methyltransferase
VVSSERYEAERRQGERIAARDLERVWGWSSAAGRVRADRRAQFLVAAGELAAGVRCLELGCGTGEFTERLVASGCTLTAVDISEASVARCRERLGGRAEVVVGNIETGEGLEGREFDAVVGVSVLHHVDVAACLRAIAPLVRPGGRFAFTEPNRANPQVWAERRFAPIRRARHVLPHETSFRADELRELFEDVGLEVQLAEPFEFLHAVTPRRLIAGLIALERMLEATPVRAIGGSVRIAARKPA